MMNAYTISGLLLTILPAAYLITAIFGVWQFRRIHERAPRHVAAGPRVTPERAARPLLPPLRVVEL